MRWLLFAVAVSALFVEVGNTSTAAELELFRKGKRIVQFFHHSLTKQGKDEFELASRFIPNVTFVRVNCSELAEECGMYHTESRNVIKMIEPAFVDYMGEDVAFEIVEFVEQLTGEKRNIDLLSAVLNEDNFSTFVGTPTIVAFLDRSNRQSEIMLPQMHQLSYVFARENGIHAGTIDCGVMQSFCISRNVVAVPTLRAYVRGKVFEFTGSREFENLLGFANMAFGTFRRSDGEVNRTAGVIREAFGILQRFMSSEQKNSALAEIQKFNGSEYYVFIMKRMLQKDRDALTSEFAKHRGLKNVSRDKPFLMDQIRRNMNILREFERAGPFVRSGSSEL